MADLSSNCRCWVIERGVVARARGNEPGESNSTSRSPLQTVAPVNVLRNKTGMTAFFCTACLLQSSYAPRNKADRRLAPIQCMEVLVWFGGTWMLSGEQYRL